MENIRVKNCVLYRAHCFAKYVTNKVLLVIELYFTQFKGTTDHLELCLLNQQQRKGWWERKPGMLVTEWKHDMKHLKAPGRQLICYGLFSAALYSWWAANNSNLFAMKVPKFQHSSSAEAAAAADDISIANAFVTFAYSPWDGCVCSFTSVA
jgi:hypothetical protein